MISIKEAILVEGRYDVNKVKQIFDTIVLETAGFGIFSDKDKAKMLRKLAEKRGLIVLTDSDGGGLVIRNYVRKLIPKEHVKHAYIPEISGKEKRKRAPGKENLLGVEGVEDQIIIRAIQNAGATFLTDNVANDKCKPHNQITKITLFETGLSGGANSSALRQKLLKKLDLPSKLSANALLDYCNCMYTVEEFLQIVSKL